MSDPKMTPTRLAEIEAAHGKATPRISMDRVSELQAECNNRHMLDPLWNQLANALGAQGFDLVDARNDIGELAAALREAWAIIVAKDAHINILDDECVTKDSEIARLRAVGDAMRDSAERRLGEGALSADLRDKITEWNAAKGGK